MTNIYPYCLATFPVGSKITCNPAPEGTDNDFLIYAYDYDKAIAYFQGIGFAFDTSHEYPGDKFTSLRQGDVNFIVTTDKEFKDKFLLATNLAKRLNVLDKQDRIALFQAVLYGKEYKE